VIHIKGNASQGLWGATFGFFIGFAAVSLFGPTASRINEVMSLDPIWIGLLVAAPALSGSLLRIPFAAWVDISGGRKPFLVLLSLSIVGMIGLFLLVHFLYPANLNKSIYPILLFLGLLSGCGIATFSVGISQVSYWFPQAKQGRALGAYAGIGNLAPGFISFLLPLALSSVGLASSYLIWLVFLFIGTLVYGILGRNASYFQIVKQGVSREEARRIAQEQHGQEIFPSNSFKESLIASASIWKTWILVLIYFTSFGGFIALTAWFPIYWTSFFKTNLILAGSLTAAFSLLASFIRVPGGFFADRWGGENTAALALCCLFVGAVILSGSHHFGLCVAGALLMALGMGITNAAVFKLLPQEGSRSFWGIHYSTINGIFCQRITRVRLFPRLRYFHGISSFISCTHLCLEIPKGSDPNFQEIFCCGGSDPFGDDPFEELTF